MERCNLSKIYVQMINLVCLIFVQYLKVFFGER